MSPQPIEAFRAASPEFESLELPEGTQNHLLQLLARLARAPRSFSLGTPTAKSQQEDTDATNPFAETVSLLTDNSCDSSQGPVEGSHSDCVAPPNSADTPAADAPAVTGLATCDAETLLVDEAELLSEIESKKAELQRLQRRLAVLRLRLRALQPVIGNVETVGVDGGTDAHAPKSSQEVSCFGFHVDSSRSPERSLLGTDAVSPTCLTAAQHPATGSSAPPPALEPSPSPRQQFPPRGISEEVDRVINAASPAEVLGIPAASDDATLQKAWRRLIFMLHPDKLVRCSDSERVRAAQALHEVHKAKSKFREASQASGSVEAPPTPRPVGQPMCTKAQPGKRRYECRWLLPEQADILRPVEKYEVHGPRVFAHTGEPMEWVLLATLPKIEGCFMFVEESPSQQEVMWAADRLRVAALPLKVHACNGRGRSDPLYVNLPWQAKFPWLQGVSSTVCRRCCTVQPRPNEQTVDSVLCSRCSSSLSPAAAVIVRCAGCHGEALWDSAADRLDCRVCGRHVASSRGLAQDGSRTPIQRARSIGPAAGT